MVEDTAADILAALAAIEQEEKADVPDDDETLDHPLVPNAADALNPAKKPAKKPPAGVPTAYCPDCGYVSNKGKLSTSPNVPKCFAPCVWFRFGQA